MATIRRFEDLECWKKARELNKEIYWATQKGSFAKDYKLKDQINAAGCSVMDNIAEGFGRGGRNEFVNFLGIAKGSANEVKSQLYCAVDRKHITEEEFTQLYSLASQTDNLIGGFMDYLNKSDVRGMKFKDRTQP